MVGKDRTLDAIACGNAELARGAGDHFQDGANRSARGNQPVRLRLGIFGNPHNAAVAGNEDHIERDVGVVHPEGDRLLLFEVEQHAVPFGQFLAKHQTAGSLRLCGRKLNAKGVHAALGDDIERAPARGLRRESGEKGRRRGNEEACSESDTGAKGAGKPAVTRG
jgi:hypothetical protein